MSDNESVESLDSDSSPESPKPKKQKLVDTRNFYFENGLAYTKDGSDLVNNIFAHNIPKEVQEYHLAEYFERLEGEVKMLEGTRVAYIHFKNPEMAAKALSMDLHTISKPKCSFSVKACDSLLQTSNSCITLLDLEDDILFHLLQFLPLKDQLALVSSHTRFIAPFQMYAKAYIRQITEDELHEQDLTSSEIEIFFQTVGYYLRSLMLYGDFEATYCPNGFSLVTSNCRNLKYFELQENPRRIRMESFHELISKMTKLRALRLVYLELDDECFHTLKLLPELTHLMIIECIHMCGCKLYLLPNLRKLYLSSFHELNSLSIKKALSTMTNLYSLSLVIGYYSKDYNDSAFKNTLAEVVDNLQTICKNVEILNLNLPHTNIRGIAELPKLRCLKFRVQQKNMHADFTALVEAQKNNLTALKIIDVYGEFSSQHYHLITQFRYLKTLHLPERNEDDQEGYSISDSDLKALCALENLMEFKIVGQHDITNNGLLEFVDKCRKLKWVNIMKTCITNGFAKDLLPLLEKSSRPNGRITFLVWGSRMSETENFPVKYSSRETKRLAIFVFKELLATLKSYDNFEDSFDKGFKFIISSFCCEDS